MTHFERTMTMNADAARVFAYISDISNYTKFLPTLERIEKLDGERVHVYGKAHNYTYDKECFFRVDQAQHKVEWGVEDGKHYHGHMVVHGGDTTQSLSDVTIGLGFHDPAVEQRGERILEGIQATLEAIRDQVHGRGGSAY